MEVEPQVAAGVARRIERLAVPLEQPLRVGEAALLLGVVGGGEEEDLGTDVLGPHLAGLDLRSVLPERRALDHREVAHHQPVEIRQAGPLHAGVGRAHRGVLADQEVATPALVDLPFDGVRRIVRAGQARQVVEAEVVLGRGRVAPPRLEHAHRVRAHVAPEALRTGVFADEGVQIDVLVRVRHRMYPGSRLYSVGMSVDPGCSRARAAP